MVLGWRTNTPRGRSELESGSDTVTLLNCALLEPPIDAADRSQISSMMNSFRANGYRLKQAFADAATYCMGD